MHLSVAYKNLNHDRIKAVWKLLLHDLSIICIWFLIALAASIAIIRLIRWPDITLKNVQHQTTAVVKQPVLVIPLPSQ